MDIQVSAVDRLVGVLSASDLIASKININDLEFVQTCFACPEQYDVFDADGKQVGYVRLRWGHLRCECPDFGGETVYEADLDDDFAGCFESDEDRKAFLEDIADAIRKHMSKTNELPFKKVFCFDNFNNGVFGSWRANFYYDVVGYDEENEEWCIKDHNGDVGIVHADEFKDYFEGVISND